MFCHTRARAWVKVRLCLLLQVGLLKCTFPSGSLITVVGLDSEMRVGLLNGHLLVVLSGGGGGSKLVLFHCGTFDLWVPAAGASTKREKTP